MLSSETPITSHILPSFAVSQLRQLLRQMTQDLGIVVTREDLPALDALEMPDSGQFMLVVSPSFSALLKAVDCPLPESAPNQPDEHVSPSLRRESAPYSAWPKSYQVNLSFATDAIATFVDQLLAFIQPELPLYQMLMQAQEMLQPNQPDVQSEFTLRLVSVLLATPQPSARTISVPIHPAFRQPAETALIQQIEQERLLNKMMTQIRQSFDLPFILTTAIQQVQQFLDVDRLVIYQFHTSSTTAFRENSSLPTSGRSESFLRSQPMGFIPYEAIANPSIPSVLGLVEECCFSEQSPKFGLYRQGYTLAIEDVESRYARFPGLLAFLQQARVRAKLIAPILVHGDLWGLLIAHQCDRTRQWQDSEKKFLQRVAEHLAIAISQAQLYAEVQQQKETLEQRVIERTQALRDAMLAAQAASQAKSEFLAAVSHELRTPLTCVIGMSSTLIRWAGKELNERQQRFLQTIHDSGEHLMELINDMLELSQLEAEKAILNLSEFSLSSLAQQTLRIVQEKAALAGVELCLDLQTAPPHDQFTADPKRVQQILLNLLTNAIKFTPQGGQVTLRVLSDDHTATLQVRDTGIGIPEQQRSLLFQKFQQLDPSYHRQYEGTGLGLALTKQLVDLHNGWIGVESTVGVGSVFTVHLPARQFHPSDITSADDLNVTSNLPQGRIMLIENDEETAHIICDILNAAGYQLVWMLEESTAVPQIEILQPVLVIANAWLSDSSGYNLIRHLRHNPATKKIKIIALSPQHSPENQQHCLDAGANDYLIKPVRPEQVLQKVITLISEKT